MNRENLSKLGAQWEKGNDEYDGYIRKLINDPDAIPVSAQEVENLKKIQKELFELETEILAIAQN